MPTTLSQIVAYVKPSLAKRIRKEVDKEEVTVSAFVAKVLRKHFEKPTI